MKSILNSDIFDMNRLAYHSLGGNPILVRAMQALAHNERMNAEHYLRAYPPMSYNDYDMGQSIIKSTTQERETPIKALREKIEAICAQVDEIKFSDIAKSYPHCDEADFNFQKDRICESLEELIELTRLEVSEGTR